MTEVMTAQTPFSDLMRRALLMAGDRSYVKVKESGAYLFSDNPDEEGDLTQEFWDIAVYLLSNKKPSDAVIRTLQKRNKKLKEYQQLDYDTLQDIKELAFSYIKTVKTFDSPEEEEIIRRIPFFEKDGYLYLTCISPDDRYSYAHLQDGKIIFSEEEIDPSGVLTRPPELPVHQDRGTTSYIVGIPRTYLLEKAGLLSPEALYTRIRNHLFSYLDAEEHDYELFVYYILYSWYYSKCSTTPYLRFLGDTGKGKSRFLKVISDLCFYPIRASGASSISGIMRFKERWMGTLLIDESDLKGDQSDPLIKYLNLGFEKDNYYILTDKNDLSKVHLFDPFGPKLIAMRQPFQDTATEGRCFSFSPDETTREDIPPELPARYADEVAELRALIARFTLEHWSHVSEECMISCIGKGIEGRLKQMARPLSVILTLFPDGQERFFTYLNNRQQEIKRTRAESFEGGMFNYVLSLAQGDEDLMIDPEFGKYYYEGRIQAITSNMVSQGLKCSRKNVTRALSGIGMESRQKRIQTATGTKNVRAFLVLGRRKWLEIMQRYYYDESGGEIPECPECLRGPEYKNLQSEITNIESFTDQVCLDDKVSCRSTGHHSGGLIPETASDKKVGFTTFREFAAYHGLEPDLPVQEYVPVPKECGSDLHCRCRGCRESNTSSQILWIPDRPYNQVCLKHLNEMKNLYEKENVL
ncbi:hypothetical protein ACKUB1_14330 [Methanospirillum stamsii]|uniref:Uncharacterized protein n=1 Tax=Methanospirillum stamsii TaxID=1277351 RepID=A0A2V2MVC2_9EURY|nr:hypothetical protein [Methanospirillum stamsii]PWR71852.1 hypothetical protein DLD82_13315 [Methanospirillum stamsii]